MRKYWTVAVLGWQDSLVYRFNALVWVLYAVLPSITFMLVWLATYESGGQREVGGLTLSQMMTYYVCVTGLAVVITPHPEWDIGQSIREGKITQFLVKPIGYYGYRFSQETAYQIVKTGMLLPAFTLMAWAFREYIKLPWIGWPRLGLFLLSVLLAYGLLTQIKFLIGISAFWIDEPAGFAEIWNTLVGIFGGRLLPLALLPLWLQGFNDYLPFSSLYSFPLQILLDQPAPLDSTGLLLGFVRQLGWLAALSVLVRWVWQRGLLAYEAYGG